MRERERERIGTGSCCTTPPTWAPCQGSSLGWLPEALASHIQAVPTA